MMELWLWSLVVAAAVMVVTGLPQEVPGLANMEILRTVPLIQATGTVYDPPSAPSHVLQNKAPRRYDVMLDYSNEEEDHFDYSDEKADQVDYSEEVGRFDYSEEAGRFDYFEEAGRFDFSKEASNDDVRDRDAFEKTMSTTLERPQTSLNTDVTDYAIFSLESIDSADADTIEASTEVLTLSDSLSLESILSTSASSHKLEALYTTERVPRGTTERVAQGRAERGLLSTSEKVHLGSEEKVSNGTEETVLLGTAEKVIQESGKKILLGTTERTPTQSKEQSTLYLRALPSSLSLQGVAGVGTVRDALHPMTRSSAARRHLPYNTFVGRYYPTASYPMGGYIIQKDPTGSYPIGIYHSGSYPSNYLKYRYPSGIYPLMYYPSADPSIYHRDGEGSTRVGHTGRKVGKNYHKSYLVEYYPQNTRSHYPAGGPPSGAPPDEALPLRYYVTSQQQVDMRKGQTNARAAHHKASHSGLESHSAFPGTLASSARRSHNISHAASTINKSNSNDAPSLRILLGKVDTRNRDEVMYYTGLQREIEKSDVLVDAIRNVRSREGKMVKSLKRKQTTIPVSPVPDIKEVRNKFGSHPLYDKLLRETSPKIKPGPILHQEKYDDEEDEYENQYLPVRAKSVELEKIHEVIKHFSTLVPTVVYRPRPFSRHPTRIPKVTTYKPPYVPNFYTNAKPVTYSSKSPSRSTVTSYGKNHRKPKAMISLSPSRTSKLVSPPHTQHQRRPSAHLLQENFENNMHSSSKNRSSISSRSQGHHRNSNHDNSKPRSQRQLVFKNQSLSNSVGHGPRSHNNNKLSNPIDHDPSSLQTERPHSVRDLSSPSMRGYNRPAIKPHPKHHSRPFSTSQDTSGDGSPPSRKEGNSKYPTSSLYEEPNLRRDPEEGARRKKGPNMEAILDASVSFPRFGYNLDPFFMRFPRFGFFDYDPDKNVSM